MKIVTLLLFLIPTFCFSQYTVSQAKKMAREANTETEIIHLEAESARLMIESRLYIAEIMIDRLLQIDSTNCNYNYRKGYVLLFSHTNHQEAIKYFQKAVPGVNIDYDPFAVQDTTCPPDIHYYIGKCYHLNDEIENARNSYTKFFSYSDNTNELNKIANVSLLQCDIADKLMASPKKSKIVNIGPMVNTSYPEYSPVISLDGEALYFTSRRPWEDGSTEQYRDETLYDYPEDIYVSYRDNGKDKTWTTPEKLSFCEGERNEATIAVSPDERRIFVYQDNTGGGDIFFSDFKLSTFQDVQPFDHKDVNTKYWETHCTATIDGQNIYFVSDKPGGLGGRDIYRIVKLPNGDWSVPKNLGPTINTPFDEDSPFIGADNKTLYFSSNGPLSMGGFDIFESIRNEDNEWSNPINLGYPLNSTGDDIFYTTTIDGKKGYFTSYRKGGFGEKDIYEIQNDELGVKNIAALRGVIKTAYNMPFPTDMTVNVKCLNCDDTTVRITYPRQRDGSFFIFLEPCKDYIFSYNAQDGKKEFFSETASTDCNIEYEEIYRDFLLDVDRMRFISPDDTIGRTYDVFTLENTKHDIIIDTDTMQVNLGTDLSLLIQINPIYFDLDKYNIRPDAAAELDKIVKIMNDNPKMVIELGSHTDCRGTKSYNVQLSANRAKSSANYIKKRITNPKRIYGKGYGETKLKNDCGCEGKVESTCSEEEHQLNRRTEFIIIKMK